MTSNPSQKISHQLNFGRIKGKEIIANFEGGRITSDAGIILMAELDKKLKISEKFAECFQDHRSLSYIDYSVHQLVSQRIYGLILGYEDVNDHDKLRHEPALAIALKKLEDCGAIVTGNYNSSPYDRTKWYALADENDLTKNENGNKSDEKSTNKVTNIKPNIKTDIDIHQGDVDDETWGKFKAQMKSSFFKAIAKAGSCRNLS